MSRTGRSWIVVAAAAGATSLLVLAAMQPTSAGALGESSSAPRVASVASLATRDFRVAVVAMRLNGGATPTADVRVAVAHRAEGSWRETGEKRLGESYFWRTVTGPRAVCRLEIATASSRAPLRPHVTVQLLLSPSLGCGRTYRLPLATR